ncbi:Uncharacterized protein dnm_028940 [Desulfonema magnum]|uniref:Uncharacterized protein n=1 Tax=Desulfonema magnum TaxID=45655 RepID=A0A975BJK3_9BACT|nr:Uncharacterized protein dnm_028940 [Desulfonema magnum]
MQFGKIRNKKSAKLAVWQGRLSGQVSTGHSKNIAKLQVWYSGSLATYFR